MDQKYKERLAPLAPYVLRTRSKIFEGDDKWAVSVRLSGKTPAALDITWPCSCGQEHPLTHRERDRKGGGSHLMMRPYKKDQCRPVYSIREIAAVFEELRPELIFGGTRPIAKFSAQVGEQIFVCIGEDIEDLDSYIEANPNKPNRPLNTPTVLKARASRITVPKVDGLAPSEIARRERLRARYPDETRYRIIKGGGTPDWHVQELMLVNGKMDWVTIHVDESKTSNDSLYELTQEPVMRGLINAHALGLAPKATLSVWQSTSIH